MKKRILVDMDGVLADVYVPLIEKEYKARGIEITQDELNGKEERLVFPNLSKIASSNEFFLNAPLIEDAIEGLRYLNEKYDLLIVSSATEFSGCINDKQRWLEKHFPFISWRQMIFCGRKSSICGDIMLDDHPKNLDNFKGKKYIFTQPHNFNIENPDYTRVNSWKEIKDIL